MATSEQCQVKLLIHEGCKIGVKNIFQHLQENTFTGVCFLINIVAAGNLNLSSFKKRLRHWCFPDSHLKFLTTPFLKRIVVRKKALL